MSGFNDLIEASAESLIYEDLSLTAGASWNIGWTILDGDSQLVDFSTCTARCDVRVASDWSLVDTWTNVLNTGKQIILNESGGVKFYAEASATQGYATDGNLDCVYEIEIHNGDDVLKLVKGKIRIYREITTSG